jgi:hypothetical protein
MFKFLHESEINNDCLPQLCNIVNETWFQAVTIEEMEERVRLSQVIAVNDTNIGAIAGVVQFTLKEYNHYSQLGQQSYVQLTTGTDDGRIWLAPPKNPVSMICMDITFKKEYWKADIGKENREYYSKILNFWPKKDEFKIITSADLTMEYVLNHAKEIGLKHAWTYSPFHRLFPFAVNLHIRHGATPTEHIIFNGRPDFKVQIKNQKEPLLVNDVKITDYSEKIIN